jgi:hydrogenase maturation protease
MMRHAEGISHTISLIGVGSPFGDDTLGWRAVDWLQGSALPACYPTIHFTFHQSDRPGAFLLEQLRGCDGAIIIDAMQAGLPPGTVRQFSAEQIGSETGLLSTHGFGVAETLALGHSLAKATGESELLPKQLSIIGIEMGTNVVAERWRPQLYAVIHQTLSEWGGFNALA